MKFSIVTVSFNQADFLEETLLSVLGQDYSEVEYIVVDPGSTDSSRDIIERYRGRIGKIIYQSDSGAAEGLNNGLGLASGEVYGFLNSDDLLEPEALSRVAKIFNADASVDMVMGHTHLIDANGQWLRDSYADGFNATAFAYQACVFCQQSTFFRADLFRQTHGFNEANKIAWDAELFLDMFARSRRIVRLDAFLSSFRLHPAAITGGGQRRAEMRAYDDAQFERIMGRVRGKPDRLIRAVYLVRKYLLEPRSLWQRLRYGSISGYTGSKGGAVPPKP